VPDQPPDEEQALLSRGQLPKGSSLVPDFECHEAICLARRESEHAKHMNRAERKQVSWPRGMLSVRFGHRISAPNRDPDGHKDALKLASDERVANHDGGARDTVSLLSGMRGSMTLTGGPDISSSRTTEVGGWL